MICPRSIVMESIAFQNLLVLSKPGSLSPSASSTCSSHMRRPDSAQHFPGTSSPYYRKVPLGPPYVACNNSNTAFHRKEPRMSGPSTLAELPVLKTIDGDELSPSMFAGKLTMAVNVASACGYTNTGYSLMKQVGEAYPNDIIVVAVPCNAFGMQENGTPTEIAEFARNRYSKLVITERTEVNGASAHPIMALGKSKFPGNISWNFDGVFLFARDGVPVARFGNSAKFSDVRAVIEENL